MPETGLTGIALWPRPWSESSSLLEGVQLPFSLFSGAQLSPPASWQCGPPTAGCTTWIQSLQRSPLLTILDRITTAWRLLHTNWNGMSVVQPTPLIFFFKLK